MQLYCILLTNFRKGSRTMPEFASFDEFQQQVFAYFDQSETLQLAYDLLEEAFPLYPEHAGLLYNWQYCAAALQGKPERALDIIQKALDAGHWWSEAYFRNDADLASLQDLPEFNRLVAISESRRQAAQAEAKPLLLTLPLPASTDRPLPLLLALHGNTLNAEYSAKDWESAIALGWLTALPQSSQLFGPEMFVWDDLEWGAREVQAHYRELTGEHRVDRARVVVGGFSKGGELAIWLTLKGSVPSAGFIAVNPGGPLVQAPDNWKPILEECQHLADLRGFFVAGEKDLNLENVRALHEMFTSHGLACELVVTPEIAHDFPEDFDQILGRALDYITIKP